MPKQYRGMAADVRALTAYVKLLRAGEGVLREASRLLTVYDLTAAQFGVLELLYRSGPQEVSELAAGILRTGGNHASVVESLRKRGLVRRSAGGRGRRMGVVALTPKGRNLALSVLPGHGAAIVSIMARLTPREQETLGELCRKLGRPSASPAAKPARQAPRRARSPRR
ncbi:MAG TPA: MarR family winged helix-turn-helix transcriptional regulator [Candidatus Dormibacteraeota bacterium]|nr:MarR family winged helix-turn-helix transcriptional regulator [Candidatus Dormibacteraeota bacterium]